jgi:hypothetical protein
MVNFKQIVLESLLLEVASDPLDEFVTQYCRRVSGNITKTHLTFLLGQLQSVRIAGKNWKDKDKIELFPVLYALVSRLGSLALVMKNANPPNKSPLDANTFFEQFLQGKANDLNNQPAFGYLKSFESYTFDERASLPEVDSIVRNAIAEAADTVLKQDVWEQIKNETITNAISSLLKKRLTGLEQLTIRTIFMPPLNSIKEVGTFDQFLNNVIDNYQTYINGQTKYSKKVAQTLYNIHISPEDLAKVVGHSRNIYTFLITKGLESSVNTAASTPEEQQKLLKTLMDKNLNDKDSNFKLFCKEGFVKYYDAGGALQTIKDSSGKDEIYTLVEIEGIRNKDSERLIALIKNMSTGVRTKDDAFKKMISDRWASLVQGAGALAAFGGAKLYG